jgi:hypothetical protein
MSFHTNRLSAKASQIQEESKKRFVGERDLLKGLSPIYTCVENIEEAD